MAPTFLIILWVVLIGFVIGLIRYSPFLFGHLRRSLSGIKLKDVHPAQENLWRLYMLSFVTLLIKVYVLGHFIVYLADSLTVALQVGFRVRLGFVMTTQLSEIIRSPHPKLWIFALNAAHQLVVMLLSAWMLYARL